MLFKPPATCIPAVRRPFVTSIIRAGQQRSRSSLFRIINHSVPNSRKFGCIAPRMAEDMPTGGDPLPNPISGTTDEASWKHRPPYKIQTDEEFGPVKWTGRCQCGQVEYKLNREKPLKSKYCHCRGCQVLHGAPFQWATIFHKSDITFTKGADGLAFYSSTEKSREYMNPTKVSCSFCRTPIMDEGRNVCLLFPASIDYGEAHEEREKWIKAFEVECHIFYSRRAVEIPDGKPKWSELDESSELLDDSGNPKKGQS
ncbi:hypothetical protein AARAC_009579 [Aspergillus arachidicola]|uniref:CENP-V/GFA domain-containing protein n=2 Tax=Aspergillus arachidicola TaxID=656916 RepID=A0A2G7EM18_9EURO|nr:hypothetical protein AARAC_009579 [Aspergillus arachidicola]